MTATPSQVLLGGVEQPRDPEILGQGEEAVGVLPSWLAQGMAPGFDVDFCDVFPVLC